MIILEGPDCIGKSTAAQWFQENKGMQVAHTGKPGPDFDHFEGYANQLFHGYVYDRFHLGEFAYGHLLEGRTPCASMAQILAVTRLIKMLGGIIVVMYSSDDVWMRGQIHASEKPEMYQPHKVVNVNRYFRWIANAQIEGTNMSDVQKNIGKGEFLQPVELEDLYVIYMERKNENTTE